MNVPMTDIQIQYQKHKAEFDAAIHRVLDSGYYILGKEVTDLENAIAKYLDVKYAVGCASGTDALQIALMALDIKPGDEVITTPFTFVATAETIVLLRATPVYVDIDERTYNIDPAKIEAAITPKTKAIIPVHLYGQAAEMDPIMQIALKHKLAVIEDNAQGIGATYKGKKVGGIGDIGTISFFPSKNLGAFGDAGMMVTNSEELCKKMRMICNHGSNVRYHHEILGVNSRLDALQAAILNVKLQYLDEWNNGRRKVVARYNTLLQGTAVVTPYVEPYNQHIYHQYTLRAQNRDGLGEALKTKGIPWAIHYPIPLHLQPAFAHLTCEKGACPVAEKVSEEVISLPIHSELTDEQLVYMTDTIREFVGTRGASKN
jgi:dTDP-4-amino-4,6-dideoxygalactose transaminase